VVLGAWVLVRQALSPVQSIMDAAREISLHHLSRRLPVPRSGDELESLSRALNEMIARLDESFQHTSRFTADASHELRTPLTIMRGELEALLARTQLPAESAAELGSVLEETMRLARTVEGLFALSRLDAGEARSERVSLDLADLVSTTVEQMCLLAEEREIDLRCETSEPVEVAGDRSRLKQVVVNLLDNAIKYTAAKGWVILRVRGDDGRAVLEVEDNGAGVSPDDLPHVFERFYRSEKTRASEAEGAGLGLSIVQAICTAHGGSAKMENLSPQGCRVTVTLPRA
jgi:heavy metal sensor kinase